MPVIIVGADTEIGRALIPTLHPDAAELRLFVSDPDAAEPYRQIAKVAIGDISDGTHVGGAAIGAFCAVVVAAAAHDGRERHFAATPSQLFSQWADGLRDAGIQRVIVVGADSEIPDPEPLETIGADYHRVDPTGCALDELAAAVATIEAARQK